ncbi:MAG: DUF637 domain-containing protein [Azoarcus sp.]|nr:DUF637 domain-containing protein [Azoarcus sp.]
MGWANAAIGLLNNQGDVGAALEYTFREDALKGYAAGAITAGLLTASVFGEGQGLNALWRQKQVNMAKLLSRLFL